MSANIEMRPVTNRQFRRATAKKYSPVIVDLDHLELIINDLEHGGIGLDHLSGHEGQPGPLAAVGDPDDVAHAASPSSSMVAKSRMGLKIVTAAYLAAVNSKFGDQRQGCRRPSYPMKVPEAGLYER